MLQDVRAAAMIERKAHPSHAHSSNDAEEQHPALRCAAAAAAAAAALSLSLPLSLSLCICLSLCLSPATPGVARACVLARAITSSRFVLGKG